MKKAASIVLLAVTVLFLSGLLVSATPADALQVFDTSAYASTPHPSRTARDQDPSTHPNTTLNQHTTSYANTSADPHAASDQHL